MRDCLIQIDRYDHRASAAIASISAVYFNIDDGSIGEKFSVRVDLDSQSVLGLTVGSAALADHFGACPTVRADLASKKRLPLMVALMRLKSFIRPGVRIWGAPAADNAAIVRNGFNTIGLECPWRPWNEFDAATVKAMFPLEVFERPDSKGSTSIEVAEMHASWLTRCLNKHGYRFGIENLGANVAQLTR